MRPTLDRALAVLARLAVRALFRSTERVGFDRLERGRPTLIVANHFNGLIDPLLIVAGLRRLPRFMAKATLWKVVVARPLLRLAGLVPVHRARDGATAGNEASFARVLEVLAAGGTAAIFPEGTTHDEPRMAEVRTGAARIAALAWAAGTDLVLVPVGITYEDKVRLRSRALVRVGEALGPDAIGRPVAIDDHEAVHELTDRIGRAVADLAPDFESTLEAGALQRIGEIARRDPSGDPAPLAAREEVARALARLPDGERQGLVDRVGRYQLALDLIDVDDEVVARRPTARSLLGQLLRVAVPMVLLLPFAVAGALINAVPTLIVSVAGRAVAAPVTKGTVRVLTALIAFPATWLALSAFDVGSGVLEETARAVTFPLSPVLDAVLDERGGFFPSLIVFVAAPLFGLATLWVLDHLGLVLGAFTDWRGAVNRRGQLADARALRVELVADVEAALGTPATP